MAEASIIRPFSDLTIYVPALNEEQTIRQSIRRMFSELPGATVVMVDDGSSDSTLARASEIVSSDLHVFRLEQNHGKGGAIKHGFDEFPPMTPFFAYLDGDMDLHPRPLAAGFFMLRDNPDLAAAIGSKMHSDSKVNYPMIRRAASKTYSFFLQVLLGMSIGDSQTGLKIFRTADVGELVPAVVSDGWAFDVEILLGILEKNLRVAELPVELDYGFDSSIRLRGVVTVFFDTISIWLRWRVKRVSKRNNVPGTAVRNHHGR